MVQVNSQNEDNAAIQSFMNNLRDGLPLVLIVGEWILLDHPRSLD